MQIDITTLSEMNAFNLSHSQAEGGENAMQNTWKNSILNTPEKLQAMRDFSRESGGWTREEIAEWTDSEINALFLQWVAGDCRELGADSLSEIDWQEAEVLQSEGEAPSNIYKGDDGKIYFYLGN